MTILEICAPPPPHTFTSSMFMTSIREFKQPQCWWKQKYLLQSEFVLFQMSSVLFFLIQFVKCWEIFLELISKRLHLSAIGKQNEIL